MAKQRIWNPYLPEYEYIPDGEPHVFGDRVYVFGSHDRFGGMFFCMNDYVAYSAPVSDLSDWRYEGVIYRRDQDPRMQEGSRFYLWAPDVAQGPDGRFYLYYSSADEFGAVGVAVCDSPAGRYTYYGDVKDESGGVLGRRPGDTIPFDPGVFRDEDGKVYLYVGNGPRTKWEIGRKPKASVMVRLGEDMLTMESEPERMLPLLGDADVGDFLGHEFFEASSIRRIGDRYYLVYSSVRLHELCYAISDRPDGGWRYGGVIVSNADLGPEGAISAGKTSGRRAKNTYGNNHGGIECVGGQYYIFYHRPTNRSMYSRQGCAELITIEADGSIRQAEMTSAGLYGEPLPDEGIYPAACVCHLYGTCAPTWSNSFAMGKRHPYLTQDGPDFDRGLLEEGNDVKPPVMYITNGKNGMVAMFRYFNIQSADQMQVTVRGKARGRLVVRTEEGGEERGSFEISPYAGWKRLYAQVELPRGRQEIYLCFEGRGRLDLKSLGFQKNA